MADLEIDTKNDMFEYERDVEGLHHMLERLETFNGIFLVRGSNIGWRNKSGERLVDLLEHDRNMGEVLLDKISPQSFEAEVNYDEKDNVLYVKVFHHDSPTGENYTVIPIERDVGEKKQVEGEKAAIDYFYEKSH